MSRFVLIPGAGGVGWYFSRVVPLLEAAGHEAIAVDLPADDKAAGPAEYATIVAGAARGSDDVVLVAQSIGGFTAPLVLSQTPVRGLVFVNAMIPAPGETAGEWWGNVGSSEARLAAASAGGYQAEFDDAVYFFHDLDPDVIDGLSARRRDETDAVFERACEFGSWPDIPIRVLAGRDDRLFPADFQRRVARERLGIEADVLPGGHLIALSNPRGVADYLLA